MKVRIANQVNHCRTHNEVSALIGIHCTVVHREAAYVLPGKWMVWFPNMSQQGGYWGNRLINNGMGIEQVYMGTGTPRRINRNPMLDYTRITFAKENGKYVFKGIFGDGKEDGARIVRFRKIANSCELTFEAEVSNVEA